MNLKTPIALTDLNQMLCAESHAERSRYTREIKAPLSTILEAGEALGPLTFQNKLNLTTYHLSGEGYYCRFRPGDWVDLRVRGVGDTSELRVPRWRVTQVRYPAPGRLDIYLQGNEPLTSDELKEIFLFRSSTEHFTKFLSGQLQKTKLLPAAMGIGHFQLAINDPSYRSLFERLNPSQKAAVEALIDNNLSGAIQGPPGTGKTHLLKAVVSLALASRMKVCVTSLTHAAVDNLLGKIVEVCGGDRWVRIDGTNKVNLGAYSSAIQETTFTDSGFNGRNKEFDLFGLTLHKLAFNIRLAPVFDLLVVDEAGQVPVFMWPFIQKVAKRVVFVGDQYQLPPVFAAEQEVDHVDLFSAVIDQQTPMLETQYRMRNEIQAWSSEKFYKGKLVADGTVAKRDFFEGHLAFFADNYVSPKEFETSDSGKTSKAEADFISNKIEKLLKSGTSLETIGIICPYRAQAGTVNASLQHKFGVEIATRIQIDTVERFQGQEREAIFLSMGCSSPRPEDLRFLSNAKRLNVAITRARSRFYCLFDSKLFRKSRGGRSEDLFEFLRWVKDGRTEIKRAA